MYINGEYIELIDLIEDELNLDYMGIGSEYAHISNRIGNCSKLNYKFRKDFFIITEMLYEMKTFFVDEVREKKLYKEYYFRGNKDNMHGLSKRVLHYNQVIEDKIATMYLTNIVPSFCQSIFVNYYALMEHTLYLYCEDIRKKLDLKLECNDLKHKGVIGYVKYIQNIARIKNIEDYRYYNEIKIYNSIRNDIIHRSGRTDNSKKLKEYQNNLNINIVDGYINLDFKDISKMSKVIYEFVEYIIR